MANDDNKRLMRIQLCIRTWMYIRCICLLDFHHMWFPNESSVCWSYFRINETKYLRSNCGQFNMSFRSNRQDLMCVYEFLHEFCGLSRELYTSQTIYSTYPTIMNDPYDWESGWYELTQIPHALHFHLLKFRMTKCNHHYHSPFRYENVLHLQITAIREMHTRTQFEPTFFR